MATSILKTMDQQMERGLGFHLNSQFLPKFRCKMTRLSNWELPSVIYAELKLTKRKK